MTEAPDQNTVELAKRYVDHISNEDGNILANVYESEAFKAIYDPHGVNERKLRLPRTLLQIHNRMSTESQLFQKVFYHPSLLQDDEIHLRQSFFVANEAHDKINKVCAVTAFAGYWPSVFYISRNTRPAGCVVFTLAYLYAYRNALMPFTLNRF